MLRAICSRLFPKQVDTEKIHLHRGANKSGSCRMDDVLQAIPLPVCAAACSTPPSHDDYRFSALSLSENRQFVILSGGKGGPLQEHALSFESILFLFATSTPCASLSTMPPSPKVQHISLNCALLSLLAFSVPMPSRGYSQSTTFTRRATKYCATTGDMVTHDGCEVGNTYPDWPQCLLSLRGLCPRPMNM